ncbi:MAG: hypothetical protein B7X04_01445 [Parcubacteria group bacterium 21-54-25]|nr:MAG: hypothetical protein B7X04_01445 [Parcubacteria group bacterium 21-54-25]
MVAALGPMAGYGGGGCGLGARASTKDIQACSEWLGTAYGGEKAEPGLRKRYETVLQWPV